MRSSARLKALGFWIVTLTALLGAGAWRSSSADQGAQKTTRDKVYSKDHAVRGEKQFGQVCAACHDPAKVAAGKKPAPPLVGEKFLETWHDRTLGELLSTISTTMPNDGSLILSDDETADLVAYILQANGFPPGPAPLKMGDAVRDIVIVK